MGVDGMVRLPALIEAAWPGGEYGDNRGWGQDRLLPFATILTTAMDSPGGHAPDRPPRSGQPEPRHGDRLSEDWVGEFTNFWQPDDFDQPNNLHYSLLAKSAALPSDVLAASPTAARLSAGPTPRRPAT